MKQNVISLLVSLVFYTGASHSNPSIPQGQSTFIDLSTPANPIFSDTPGESRFLTIHTSDSFKADISLPEFDQPIDI